MSDHSDFLPSLASRRDYFDFLDGHSVKTADELYERRLGRGLVKTYMLETSANGDGPSLEQVFHEAGADLKPVGDDGLQLVVDSRIGAPVALLEPLEARHPVLYTLLETRLSDPWVRRLVDSSPWLDRLWLSAPIFSQLWGFVRRNSHPRRYTKLSFEYEARFEPAEGFEPDEGKDPEVESDDGDDTEDDREGIEEFRRTSRFTMVDRVEAVASKLPALQGAYRPLLSTTQLRIPATGRGGHDFYFDGKVTNRGDSFLDHRQTVALVLRMYRSATEEAERALWISLDEGVHVAGSPVFMRFSEELEPALFERWIESTFQGKGNRFRLAGKVFRVGDGKVHVYGVDRHLWQPILLELTPQHVTAFLPRGTCGNTVHRLITNLQRFVDPGIRAWIGERAYEAVVDAALTEAVAT